MIQQKVNFFHPQFHPQSTFFSARNTLIISLVLLLVVSLFSVGLSVYREVQRSKLETLIQEGKESEEGVVDPVKLQTLIQCQGFLKTVFHSDSESDFFYLAQVMEQFSTVLVSGVWLTGMERLPSGSWLISGAARPSVGAGISQFAQQLAREKIFSGYFLSSINVEPLDKSKQVLTFQITIEKRLSSSVLFLNIPFYSSMLG